MAISASAFLTTTEKVAAAPVPTGPAKALAGTESTPAPRPTSAPVLLPRPSGSFTEKVVMETFDQYEVPFLELASTPVTFRLTQPSNWQTTADSKGAATFSLRGYQAARVSFAVYPKVGFIPNVEKGSIDSYAAGLLITWPESKGYQVTFNNLGNYDWTVEAGATVQTNPGAVKGFSLRLVQHPLGTMSGRLDYTVTSVEPNGKSLSLRTLDILCDAGENILICSYTNTPDIFAGPPLSVFEKTVLNADPVQGIPAPKPAPPPPGSKEKSPPDKPAKK